MKLKQRKLMAKLAKPFSSGLSSCGRCNRTWNICTGHTTQYNEYSGCFPLCEECWGELTPEQRLPYYMDLMDIWESGGRPPSVREDVRKAVLEGK